MKNKPAKPVKTPAPKLRKAAESSVTNVTDVDGDRVTINVSSSSPKRLPFGDSALDPYMLKMPPHAPRSPVVRLLNEERPNPTAIELATLVGALNFPATRDGASAALRCVWECALVLKEQADGLKLYDDGKAQLAERNKNTCETLGFDVYVQSYPMKHEKFIALLKKSGHLGGIKIDGKQVNDFHLFGKFAEANTSLFANLPLTEFETKGWTSPSVLAIVALRFIKWRNKLAKGNKARTKKNLKKGGV